MAFLMSLTTGDSPKPLSSHLWGMFMWRITGKPFFLIMRIAYCETLSRSLSSTAIRPQRPPLWRLRRSWDIYSSPETSRVSNPAHLKPREAPLSVITRNPAMESFPPFLMKQKPPQLVLGDAEELGPQDHPQVLYLPRLHAGIRGRKRDAQGFHRREFSKPSL